VGIDLVTPICIVGLYGTLFPYSPTLENVNISGKSNGLKQFLGDFAMLATKL
jgi:hypothetical protein